MVTVYYRFGHCTIGMLRPEEMKSPQNLEKFRIPQPEMEESQDSQIMYQVDFREDLDGLRDRYMEKADRDGEAVIREDLQILRKDGGEFRFLNFKGSAECYAASVQENESSYRIFFAPWLAPQLDTDTIFLAPFALERQIIRTGGLILHSAFLNYGEEAILFSAPSGVGKSTQAGLWERYREAETVNGDRSLLLREQDGWYACGWPVCGSSHICKNERWKIHAIVMLEQARENCAETLKGMEAFRRIVPQITVNRWDKTMQEQVLDQIELLLQEVLICGFKCNISEEAVGCLEEYLDREAVQGHPVK